MSSQKSLKLLEDLEDARVHISCESQGLQTSGVLHQLPVVLGETKLKIELESKLEFDSIPYRGCNLTLTPSVKFGVVMYPMNHKFRRFELP